MQEVNEWHCCPSELSNSELFQGYLGDSYLLMWATGEHRSNPFIKDEQNELKGFRFSCLIFGLHVFIFGNSRSHQGVLIRGEASPGLWLISTGSKGTERVVKKGETRKGQKRLGPKLEQKDWREGMDLRDILEITLHGSLDVGRGRKIQKWLGRW